ncbi:MAG TPA: aldose epimerase family protein [Clostridia bacterium]|nr:aldose epimerase family protein [Clostridia bacterium]
MRISSAFCLLIASTLGLGLSAQAATKAGITREPFGTTADGKAVELFTLRNSKGVTAQVITYGAIIYSLEVPDRNGQFTNVMANRENLHSYETKGGGFGALIGRYANRIAGGNLVIDGKQFSLPLNNGTNHIHGGPNNFSKRVWSAEPLPRRNGAALKLSYTSADGEEGFPGKLECTVVYELNNRNEWKMDCTATTDKATVINLCNHGYWNLAGVNSGTVLDHTLKLYADKYVVVDEALIPTGKIAPVAGTPLDFRSARKIGERIGEIKEKQFNGGYDHCLVINQKKPGALTLCAEVKEPKSGRTMRVLTTEPGVQVYSANAPSGTHTGPNGYAYPKYLGLCLETQHYPDSPNQPGFPSTLLRPGQVFRSTTIHRFGVD